MSDTKFDGVPIADEKGHASRQPPDSDANPSTAPGLPADVLFREAQIPIWRWAFLCVG